MIEVSGFALGVDHAERVTCVFNLGPQATTVPLREPIGPMLLSIGGAHVVAGAAHLSGYSALLTQA